MRTCNPSIRWWRKQTTERLTIFAGVIYNVMMCLPPSKTLGADQSRKDRLAPALARSRSDSKEASVLPRESCHLHLAATQSEYWFKQTSAAFSPSTALRWDASSAATT